MSERDKLMVQIGNAYHRAIKEGRTEAFRNGFISVCDLLGFSIIVDREKVKVTDQFSEYEDD